MNELFLSGTILTLVKTPTTGDTSHVVCQLRYSHASAAAGDSRNLHGSCVESPCGLGGPDVETRCAGVCQGVSDAEFLASASSAHHKALIASISLPADSPHPPQQADEALTRSAGKEKVSCDSSSL